MTIKIDKTLKKWQNKLYACMCNVRGFCVDLNPNMISMKSSCYVRLWLAGAPWPRPRDRTPPWRWTRRCHRWKRLQWLRGTRSVWDVRVNVIRITGHNEWHKRRWHRHIAHVSYVAHFPHYGTRLKADENATKGNLGGRYIIVLNHDHNYIMISQSYNISSRNLPTSKTLTCHVIMSYQNVSDRNPASSMRVVSGCFSSGVAFRAETTSSVSEWKFSKTVAICRHWANNVAT